MYWRVDVPQSGTARDSDFCVEKVLQWLAGTIIDVQVMQHGCKALQL
jgi:hypothetical protein